MDPILVVGIVNFVITVIFGIFIVKSIDEKDSDKKFYQRRIMELESDNNALNRDYNGAKSRIADLESDLIRMNDKKEHLEKRLEGCNGAYNKAMEMNKHQEGIIDNLEKWTRGRDIKTGRFKPKNK
jgi:chromosome segregation ATPase